MDASGLGLEQQGAQRSVGHAPPAPSGGYGGGAGITKQYDIYPAQEDGQYDSFSLKVIFVKNRTGFEESKEFPIRINSIIAGRYQVLEYLGSAAFSRAIQCYDLATGKYVCIKIIKNNKDFFDQSLDEIKLLQYVIVRAQCCIVLSCTHCLFACLHYRYINSNANVDTKNVL